jgi:hypothetical protein
MNPMGEREVLWTDPANWMWRPVALDVPFRYRCVIGDTTDLQMPMAIHSSTNCCGEIRPVMHEKPYAEATVAGTH